MIWAIRQTLIGTVLPLVLLSVCCAARIACADGAPAPSWNQDTQSIGGSPSNSLAPHFPVLAKT